MVSRRMIEIAVAAVTWGIGLAIIADSIHLGVGWANDSPEPGYFPVRVGAIMAIASMAVAVQALRDGSTDAQEPFVSWPRFKPVLAVFIPTALYVAAIATIGIYVASALFIAAFMRVAGRFSLVTAAAVGIGTVVLLFWTFEILFLVPLPKGPLEAWLGY